MRISLLITLLLVSFYATAQINLQKLVRQSRQVMVFRIPATDAERYLSEDSIPLNYFENIDPTYIIPVETFQEDSLPGGHYVVVRIVSNEVIADVVGVSGLIAYPVNNRHNIQIDLRTNEGQFIRDAKVWSNGKTARYDAAANTYVLPQKKLHGALVKIYTPGDTLFLDLYEDREPPYSILKQRWQNFKATNTGRVVTWIPRQVNRLIHARRYRWRNKKLASGYMLLNQPKYKLTDTIKLKAYIINKHKKRYNKELTAWLEYRDKSAYKQQQLSEIKPVSPGSYTYSFPLSDTLPLDTRYSIVLRNKHDKVLISKEFTTEDYLLDDIGSYDFRSAHSDHYPGDTITFYASAKDANGLPLLDGKVQLTLLSGNIASFSEKMVYVPDTLYNENKPLNTEDETVFKVPVSKFPKANIDISALATFRNSNNELHQENVKVKYLHELKELKVTVTGDSIAASYMVNGKSIPAIGTLRMEGDNIERLIETAFPLKLKIDPLAEEYLFEIPQGRDTLRTREDIEGNYSLTVERISRQDTLGFVLNNPYKIPVNFIVLHNNKVVASGKSDSARIPWQMVSRNKHWVYAVKWQYMWGGTVREGSENIALLYKLLKIETANSSRVFPGQRDSITVSVTDYKNQPAKEVNLAAVGYNTQFKSSINVPEPPYLASYKNHPSIIRSTYETDNGGIKKHYPLGDYQGWTKKLGTDSMQFYKMLFPEKTLLDVVSPISEFIPQLSVHVVSKGRPQEVYLLYINRQLAYYNGVTEKMPYAFNAVQGYTQIAFRLYDKYVELDSLYMQPFYKHDVVIDMDNLSARARVKDMPKYWTPYERDIIEKSIWQLGSDRRTDYGYVWQNERLAKLSGSRLHLVGPFRQNEALQFFAPADFDVSFPFEPRYRYALSNKLTRLERQNIFSDLKQVHLPKTSSTKWTLGDTLLPPLTIAYPKVSPQLYIPVANNLLQGNAINNGKLQFTVTADTAISLRYVVLIGNNNASNSIVKEGTQRTFTYVPAGAYTLLLINKDWQAAQIDNVIIRADETLCLQTESYSYTPGNKLVKDLLNNVKQSISKLVEVDSMVSNTYKPVEAGNSSVTGKINDREGGNGIPGAIISIKGTQTIKASANDGSFSIANIRQGIYTLVVSSVGYNSKEIVVELRAGETKTIDVRLTVSTLNLQDVVVTGYGIRRKNFTGSIATIRSEELTSIAYTQNLQLQGRVAGLSVSRQADNRIAIRGAATTGGQNKPIYVIDGILYDEMPKHLKPGLITSMEALKDAAATAIYGSRAANGAIVITTGSKEIRSDFKDYAIWQPELNTDSEGKARFQVTYPDNITGWELFILGMDKHLRIGKSKTLVQAFKPVAAQLNTPQFLIQGDRAKLVGKALNHTGDAYDINTKFEVADQLMSTTANHLQPNASITTDLMVTASNTDTLKTSYIVSATTGFKDGEEKKIPVFRQGSQEAQGAFYIMQTDSVVGFMPKPNGERVTLFVQNNTLDVLLDELQHLREYPYYCMEQTASKLKGLLMEKKIMEDTGKPFKYDKEIKTLLKKLQQAQLFEGGWSWWENGKPDLFISAYVTEVLLLMKDDPLVQTNIRNALLYLQNQLPGLKGDQLLGVLNTLSTAGHIINYKPYLKGFAFDSLTQHQQWLYVQVVQTQKFDYTKLLQRLVNEATPTMLGGIHWGVDNYRWYSNATATTLVAYQVLEKEKEYQYLLPKITQFFLEQKRGGYYRNTVEAASIVSTLLPNILKARQQFLNPASITITGDTTLTVSALPFKISLPISAAPYNISKTGGGLTYVTMYQNWWNNAPSVVSDKFVVNSYFKKNGRKVLSIDAGEKVRMAVTVNVLADAEYVLIEMPIPAGCNYSSKDQDWRGMHREYFKNKVVLFAEKLTKGEHTFEIDLEPRYKGIYTLNPAKAELMYFPTFYGRNQVTRVEIR